MTTEFNPPKRKWLLRISIIFNILFILGWALNYVTSPTYELGILTQDVTAGFLGTDSTFIKIPKGLTVRNVSQRGLAAIGQFENNRFEVVFTSDNSEIVNYNISQDKLFQFGNYYSVDCENTNK